METTQHFFTSWSNTFLVSTNKNKYFHGIQLVGYLNSTRRTGSISPCMRHFLFSSIGKRPLLYLSCYIRQANLFLWSFQRYIFILYLSHARILQFQLDLQYRRIPISQDRIDPFYHSWLTNLIYILTKYLPTLPRQHYNNI